MIPSEELEESMSPSMEHGEDDVEEEPPRVVSVVHTSTRTSSYVRGRVEAATSSSNPRQGNPLSQGFSILSNRHYVPVEAYNDLLLRLNAALMENLPVSAVYAAVIILRSGVIRPCCLPPYTTGMRMPSPHFNQLCVYVWNLPPQFTQSDLIAYFEPFGLIAEASVEVNLARTDQRRHAFVRYYNLESGRAAIANMDGRVMSNCRLAAMLYFPIQIRM
ncbi:hypothetical protein EmuJ_001160300 [Echinococcus multilocularis]|uniref:RRM domain-containing protein n=1 Tax=Echinococcus multilocularis TaxID=6211 RepID=A0A068XTU3_ECHMU|nr:hypothetical protein EmuJ_001160300 [Echinococcus multilocularis]